MLIVPSDGESVADAGKRIAELAVQPVAWPADVSLTSKEATPPRMLPAQLPPLRTDRDSVVLLAGPPAAGELAFSLTGVGAEPVAVTLPLAAAVARDEHAYLGVLARNAWDTDGVFLPLLGREGMQLARNVIRGEAAALAELSKQAEASGAHDSAVRLAEALLVARGTSLGPDAPAVAYLGDTVADVQSVLRARERVPAQRFLSLAVAPPHLHGPGQEPRRLAYEQQLLAAGADRILSSTDQVGGVLESLLSAPLPPAP
jgi:hypothetical protein